MVFLVHHKIYSEMYRSISYNVLQIAEGGELEVQILNIAQW